MTPPSCRALPHLLAALLLLAACATPDAVSGALGTASRLQLVSRHDASARRCRLILSVPRNGGAVRSSYIVESACSEFAILDANLADLELNDLDGVSPATIRAIERNAAKGLLLVDDVNGLTSSLLYVDASGRVREVPLVY